MSRQTLEMGSGIRRLKAPNCPAPLAAATPHPASAPSPVAHQSALVGVTAAIAVGLHAGYYPTAVVVGGLAVFGVAFAVNSSVHSYLILAYTDGDKVALNVGFYYMANAGGRLVGTLLSGVVFQWAGLVGCLWVSVAFIAAAGILSLWLPKQDQPKWLPVGVGVGDEG
jgi:MFS transporter, APGE family, 1-arseno-3-phosphoglycerate exporter